jgi:hypothetical protein
MESKGVKDMQTGEHKATKECFVSNADLFFREGEKFFLEGGKIIVFGLTVPSARRNKSMSKSKS